MFETLAVIQLTWPVIALLASILSTGATAWSLKNQSENQNRQFELSKEQLGLEEKKLNMANEAEVRASKERRAMTNQDMLRAVMLSDKDRTANVAERREQRAFMREQSAEDRAFQKESETKQMQVMLIQALLDRGRRNSDSIGGNRVPITKLIGLGD